MWLSELILECYMCSPVVHVSVAYADGPVVSPSIGAPSAICTAELQRLADCLRHIAEAVQISALPSCRGCLTASAVCRTASAMCLGCVPASPMCLTYLAHCLMPYLYVAYEVWHVDNGVGVAGT